MAGLRLCIILSVCANRFVLYFGWRVDIAVAVKSKILACPCGVVSVYSEAVLL